VPGLEIPYRDKTGPLAEIKGFMRLCFSLEMLMHVYDLNTYEFLWATSSERCW